ncbi:MAG: glycosyltransferase [Nitrososphaerota archaeon]
MQNIFGVVTVTTHGPYGFSYVAQEIAHVLNMPLMELSGKLGPLNYLKPLRVRPSFIISVGTIPPKKLMLFSVISKRVIAYVAVEGPFPISKSILWLANNTNRLFIVTPSNYVKNELSSLGLKVKCVIPHGVDSNRIRRENNRLNLPLNKVKVLTVASSLQYRKLLGLLYILRAWSKLPWGVRKNGFLIFKLPKETGKSFKEIMDSLGFRNDEYMLLDSYFTRNEMFALYRAADLYVHPALSDGFGLPIIEALACGTPTIVLNAEPWNEIVTENVGWFVKVDKEIILHEDNLPYRLRIPNIHDFSKKIAEAILCCKENREILKKKCAEYARIFDSRKVYGKFKELIKDLISHKTQD